MKIKKAIVTTHYAQDDEDCNGDYYGITLELVGADNKKKRFEFGDSYHDGGQEKVEGAIEVLKGLLGDFNVQNKVDNKP